jgi:hypothetical protein
MHKRSAAKPLSRSSARVRRASALVRLTGALLLLAPRAASAQVAFNVYGDTDYNLLHQAGNYANAFSAPRLDLFPSGSAGRFSFLAEVLFEVDANNSFGVDVERIEAAWLISDYLRVRLGRFHTAFGYYNDAFHHGVYFQLPTERPGWVDFEDNGGLIPSHTVGLHLDGRVPLGGFASLRYDLEVGNGRGRVVDDVQNLTDVNNSKAVNLRLRLEPRAVPGLIVGANVYLDRISANNDLALAAPIPEMDERIIGAHAAYLEGPLHLIAEGAAFFHLATASPATYTTIAGFIEAGWSFGDFTPYLLAERVSFPTPMDPFFATASGGAFGTLTAGAFGSYSRVRAGVKWTASDNFALKLELGHTFNDVGSDVDGAALQAAFAY